MTTQELHYWIAFSAFLKIGPMKFKKLLGYFSSAEYAFFAPGEKLLQAGLEGKLVEEFFGFRQRFRIEPLLKALERETITLCPVTSPDYPPLLKHIHNPPFLLYVKGNAALLNNNFTVAIVGTRKCTTYGLQVAHEMGRDLSCQGIGVISGGALGIDTAAHQGALPHKGSTVAVLAGGLDEASWFPKDNTNFFKKILAQGGALLSENPPSVQAQPFSFPQRNRIVSGMSLGTVVVEAPKESGALITAACALEQNREVFAVPGSVYSPTSVGPHNLLTQGAQLVGNARDIMEALQLSQVASKQKVQHQIPTNPQEETILRLLSKEPVHVDALVARSGLNTAGVNATLTTLEMKGIIRNLGNMNYITL